MQVVSTNQIEKVAALRSSRYFSDLTDGVIEEISLGVSLRRYERDEVLFWEGDPCAGLYIIHKGSLKLFKVSPQGRELIINILREGASLNEVPVFDRGNNPVSAAALELTEVWLIDVRVLRDALDRHHEMCPAIIESLSANLRLMVQKVEELSFYQVTHRLARLISQLPEEQLSGLASYRLTQNQLAAQLGTVREVVARSLGELERSGAIKVRRRQIEIVDKTVLKSWAQTPGD